MIAEARCIVVLLLFYGVGLSKSFSTELPADAARRVCVVAPERFQVEAQSIATELQIPLLLDSSDDNAQGFTHQLRLVPLELYEGASTYALALEADEGSGQEDGKNPNRRKPKQKPKINPFYIDLCPPRSSRIGRRGSSSGGSDLLVKAVSPKKGQTNKNDGAVIYDLTAGLGQDSLVLAINGARKVHMVERDPFVAALLKDALRRLEILATAHEIDTSVKDRAALLIDTLSLYTGESLEILETLQSSESVSPPDIIYLDPMFPPRTKSSKVKKGMRLLHCLLDTQQKEDVTSLERLTEEFDLLQAAVETARVRVVVKRPSKAVHLGGNSSIRPSYSIDGSVNRWDVYVTK